MGHEPSEPVDSHWNMFLYTAAELVYRARSIAATGISHRGFRVGAAALAFDYNGAPHFLEAANNSPYPGSPKDCGEMGVIENARLQRLVIYAIVNAGRPQQDQISKLESPTLHQCHACRQQIFEDMNSASSVILPETIAWSVHPKRNISEMYPERELLEIHRLARLGMRPELNVYRNSLSNVGAIHEILEDFAEKHPWVVQGQKQPPIFDQ